MSEIKYSELDFFQIKENLKNYLKSQDKFKDYNFDGSSMSILLDVLAYNTSYNAFYLNMLASEMFLDSASMRESVLSRAKHLGYSPRSVRTLRSVVDITFDYGGAADANIPTSILLNRDVEFFGISNNVRYPFVVKNSKFLSSPIDKKFLAEDVELIQGKRFTHSYVVDPSAPIKQRFIIPNNNVDTTSLIVTVKDSSTSASVSVFNQFNDLTVIKPTDLIYYLQPYDESQYEVVFGDGVFGKALVAGNVITLDYVVSSGIDAEGIKKFTIANATPFKPTSNTQLSVLINVITPASGFSEAESIESIKLLAPRSYEAQNRAVTKLDYETLLKRDVPEIKNIRVWGGEENDPPIYGKIFCAIQPQSGFALNTQDKERIINSYINPRKVLSLDIELVEPEYFNLMIDSTVNFFSYKTTNNPDAIKNIVLAEIKKFAEQNLTGFDSDFRHSRLLKSIDNSESSIESNSAEIKIKYSITPPFNLFFDYTIQLNNEIDKGDFANDVTAIDSTEFIYNGNYVKLADDGKGRLFLYYTLNASRVIVNDNMGDVDYKNGKIVLRNFFVNSIPNGGSQISLIITPKENDIIAFKNQIILLEESDISISVVDLTNKKLS